MSKQLKKQYSVDFINTRMALRSPQLRALESLDNILQNVDLSKDTNEEITKKIHELYPTFREFEFERSFPSMTFALATGVGKTILMGAFITYLYTNHDIKNFFIVTPNLTVYNKLIKDFSDPNFKKYVFKRLQVFVQTPPNVITGDTYKDIIAGQQTLEQSITINIFNIGKINAEVKGGKEPQVKQPWEVLGQSYFDYLVKLPDLVVLMDESHHYRADRGMTVINELEPLLGLELTATPWRETNKGPIKFKNVVFEYSLAKAMADGFVKNPAVATRKSFDKMKWSDGETDEMKLVDGLRIHQNTKAELEVYAQNENKPLVKPFVLVVCKDTEHARVVKEYIQSSEFHDGYYADKVMELHSNQRGSEKEENIGLLLSLENPDNHIEIVIHVNMLKEGWDVTNLYTIIPLRTAASMTLREQTIGRGLRLPYGERTGNTAVDRLIIVAHDKFDEIIKAADDENSIIKRENIIDIDEDDEISKDKEKYSNKTAFDNHIAEQERKLRYARSDKKKDAIEQDIAVSKATGQAIEWAISQRVLEMQPMPITQIEVSDKATQGKPVPKAEKPITMTSTKDLKRPEVQEIIKAKTKEILEERNGGQLSLELVTDITIDDKIEKAYAPLIEQKINSTIDIPDVVVSLVGEQVMVFENFTVSDILLNFKTPSTEILIESLTDSDEREVLYDTSFITMPDTPENTILVEILNREPLISYDENADLLYNIIGQALKIVGKHKTDDELKLTIMHHKKEIARELISQIKGHSHLTEPEYEVKILNHVTPILTHNYTKFKADDVVSYKTTIPAYQIRHKIVGEFEKACHTAYKFDSTDEQTFVVALERNSNNVIRWLRPTKEQFKIHWDGQKLYEPDFVVETDDDIYIAEVKAHNQIDNHEVQMKAKAATAYCNNVNMVYGESSRLNKKPWKYLLLAAHDITRASDFDSLTYKNQYSMR